MDLENDLRETLHEHATDAPGGAGTLERVRARAHRLDVRRRAAAIVVAVCAVAVAISAPYLVDPFRTGGSTPVGVSSAPTTSATTSPPARSSTVELAVPAFAPVTFPLDPGWTPPGLPQPTIGRTQGLVRLVYAAQSALLIATVSGELPPAEWTPTTTTQIKVGTRDATLYTGTSDAGAAVRITWQLPDRRWIDVHSAGPFTSDQIRQYANSLRAQPMPPPALPFTLQLAPKGFEVSFQEIDAAEFHFCLAPPAEVDGDTDTWLCLSKNADNPAPGSGEPVTVGPDQGEFSQDGAVVQLRVHRPDFEFLVTVNEEGPLNRPDLIRYAAGVAAR